MLLVVSERPSVPLPENEVNVAVAVVPLSPVLLTTAEPVGDDVIRNRFNAIVPVEALNVRSFTTTTEAEVEPALTGALVPFAPVALVTVPLTVYVPVAALENVWLVFEVEPLSATVVVPVVKPPPTVPPVAEVPSPVTLIESAGGVLELLPVFAKVVVNEVDVPVVTPAVPLVKIRFVLDPPAVVVNVYVPVA